MAKKKVKKKKAKRSSEWASRLSLIYGSRLAVRDLILFSLLSLISYILYSVTGNGVYQDTFYLLAMIFGFMALAFLIVWLAIAFSKDKKKAKKKPSKKKAKKKKK